MKTKLFTTAISLFLSSIIFSQSGKINGKISDKSDKKPIEFATISLHKTSDSSMVTGAITNKNGEFEFKKITYGDYYIKARYIGYNPQFIKLDLKQKKLVLIPIQLENFSSNLKEVEIAGEQSAFENKIDKKVFNVDKSPLSKGGNGLDMLRNVPSIEVDENENIKLRGNTSVNVLIDGRPSAIPVSQLLKQIPASAISKVEIITNPSAKYDPEGMSGIINIVMKKNKMNGFNGAVNTSLSYGKTLKTNNSIALNYRNKRFNFHTNITNRIGKFHFGGLSDRDVLLNDSLWNRLYIEDNGTSSNQAYNFKGGIDFFMDDNNVFYLSGNYYTNNGFGDREISYENYLQHDSLIGTSNRNQEAKNPDNWARIIGGWQKTFPKSKATLDIDINYARNIKNTSETLSQSFKDANNSKIGTPYYQNTTQKEERFLLFSKADFTLPVNDSVEVEMGIHFTSRDFGNDFSSESRFENTVFQTDLNLNNNFKYKRDVLAGYATYGKQFKKIGVKVGLRAEQTNTTSQLITTSEKYENNYFKLFPSAHLSYKINPKSELRLSYSKRINRPNMGILNPFSSYSDPYTLQTGNPFLQPEIIHVNELGYVKYFKKVVLNSTIYYRYLTNMKRRVLTHEGEISTVSYKNIGTSDLKGAEIILTYSPIKRVRITSTTNIWNTTLTDELITQNEKVNATGFSERLSLLLMLKKGWVIQMSGDYQPEQEVQQGIITPMYGMGIAVQKRVLKNKGSLSLRFSDVLGSRGFKFISHDLGDYTFVSSRSWESQTVTINFTYSFGKRIKSKQKRNLKRDNTGDNKKAPGM